MKGRIQPRNLRQQVTVEKRRRNILFFGIMSAAFLYICTTLIFGDMGLIKYVGLNRTRARLEAGIHSMEKENSTLKKQVSALKQDTFYIEKYAREEYGLARPDEYIFQFKDDER
jgi:cell division protein FtsB